MASDYATTYCPNDRRLTRTVNVRAAVSKYGAIFQIGQCVVCGQTVVGACSPRLITPVLVEKSQNRLAATGTLIYPRTT